MGLLRHALRADLDLVVDVWVDAFTDDPYLRWIQPDDAAWPAFGRDWMAFIAGLAFERGHTYVGTGGDVAVAWIPPDLAFVDADGIARGRSIIAEHAGAERADLVLATILEARAHGLDEAHWTLQYIGVRPARRGSGLGAASVADRLAVCDDEGLPCGLVSTNTRNVPFYERLGFGVDAEVPTPDGAVVLRAMHRRPVTAA